MSQGHPSSNVPSTFSTALASVDTFALKAPIRNIAITTGELRRHADDKAPSHPNDGSSFIDRLLALDAKELRRSTGESSKSLTVAGPSPTYYRKLESVLKRYKTFASHVLKDAESIPKGADLERFLLALPSLIDGRGKNQKLSYRTIEGTMSALETALTFQYDKFRLSDHEKSRLRSTFHTMIKKGVVETDHKIKKHWITHHVIRQLSEGLISDAWLNGTECWDKVIARLLGLVLQASCASRSGDISLSSGYTTETLKFQDVRLRLIVEDGKEKWVGLFALCNKGRKWTYDDRHKVLLKQIDDPTNSIVDPIKLLIVYAMRIGAVSATNYDEIAQKSRAQYGKDVVWARPEWPVLCAFPFGSSVRGLITDKPCGTDQLHDTLRYAAQLCGIKQTIKPHDIRRGSARELANLNTIGGATPFVAAALGHTYGSLIGGTTGEYIGHLNTDTWASRLEASYEELRESYRDLLSFDTWDARLRTEYVDHFSPFEVDNGVPPSRESKRLLAVAQDTNPPYAMPGQGACAQSPIYIDDLEYDDDSYDEGNDEYDVEDSDDDDSDYDKDEKPQLGMYKQLTHSTRHNGTNSSQAPIHAIANDIEAASDISDSPDALRASFMQPAPEESTVQPNDELLHKLNLNTREFVDYWASINIVKIGDSRTLSVVVHGNSRNAPTKFMLACPNSQYGCEYTCDHGNLLRLHIKVCKRDEARRALEDKMAIDRVFKPRRCLYCDDETVFQTEELYNKHQKDDHPHPTKWTRGPCPIGGCKNEGNIFTRRSNLKIHLRDIHQLSDDRISQLLPEQRTWVSQLCGVAGCQSKVLWEYMATYITHLKRVHNLVSEEDQDKYLIDNEAGVKRRKQRRAESSWTRQRCMYPGCKKKYFEWDRFSRYAEHLLKAHNVEEWANYMIDGNGEPKPRKRKKGWTCQRCMYPGCKKENFEWDRFSRYAEHLLKAHNVEEWANYMIDGNGESMYQKKRKL